MGAPRIHGELLKVGIAVSERTVSRLMPKRSRPPSQTWRTFLANHIRDLVASDFFIVPTVHLRVLFVLVVLAHHRRRILHFNVTEHPTAEWSAQQIVDAFPDDTAPAHLLRDRDKVYAASFRQRAKGLGICEVLTALRSPWQNPFAERLIGSVRRECLDHVLVLSEKHLRRILTRYFTYYLRSRTHLSLAKDAPDTRPIARRASGHIIQIPEVGGLRHRYERRASKSSFTQPLPSSLTFAERLPSPLGAMSPTVRIISQWQTNTRTKPTTRPGTNAHHPSRPARMVVDRVGRRFGEGHRELPAVVQCFIDDFDACMAEQTESGSTAGVCLDG